MSGRWLCAQVPALSPSMAHFCMRCRVQGRGDDVLGEIEERGEEKINACQYLMPTFFCNHGVNHI